VADGLVDDSALARDVVAARSSRGWGRAKVLAELERRGVAAGTAEAAWSELVAAGDVVPEEIVEGAVGRRLGGTGGRVDARTYGRARAALARAGFEEDEIDAALAARRPAEDDVDPGVDVDPWDESGRQP
jgi:SOS response regulatory protein OraA/RecX